MPSQKYFRIGMIITKLSGSGAERVTLNLAEMFARHGHPVDIILLEDTVDFAVDASIRLHFLSSSRRLYKWSGALGDRILAKKLKHLIHRLEQSDRLPFDLFISHLPAADKVVALCRLPNTLYCIHSSYSGEIIEFRHLGRNLRAGRKQRLYQRLYSGRDLIAVSQGTEQDVLQNMQIKPLSIQTIHNPFNFDQVRQLASDPSVQLPEFEFIIHAGAFRPVKRHDILLTAFSQIKHNFKLVLLTDPCRELDAIIQELGLGNKVLVAGYQQNPYPFMKAAKLMVLSSEREGLPTVAIESLICGTPVVSTDCPSGPREILGGELAKWLVPVNDPLALAEKIDRALDTAITLDDSLIEKFSSESVYKQYSDLITANYKKSPE